MKNPLKTFDDLTFAEVPKSSIPTLKANIRFENGYGVSVLTGDGSLTTREKPYELAVLQYDQSGEYKLIYPSLFNHDILSCLTSDEVSEYMRIIQVLPELF
jgi:hypothetical protein